MIVSVLETECTCLCFSGHCELHSKARIQSEEAGKRWAVQHETKFLESVLDGPLHTSPVCPLCGSRCTAIYPPHKSIDGEEAWAETWQFECGTRQFTDGRIWHWGTEWFDFYSKDCNKRRKIRAWELATKRGKKKKTPEQYLAEAKGLA